MYIDLQVLKDYYSNYDDKSSYNNYLAIAKKYNQLYNSALKDKKIASGGMTLSQMLNDHSSITKDKLRDEIKNWFFSLSIESRIKVATVENELFCEAIFHMYHMNKDEQKYYNFKETLMKGRTEQPYLIAHEYDENIMEDDCICKPNSALSTLKISKESKNKITTQEYNVSKGKGSSSRDLEFNFERYFSSSSSKKYETNNINIYGEIYFFSIHHSNTIDCFTLSPNLVINDSLFKNIFNMSINKNYFYDLIKPIIDKQTSKTLYTYSIPTWMECASIKGMLSLHQIIYGLIEQSILIKFILNYNVNNTKNPSNITHSIINEVSLNSFFDRRKSAIDFIRNSYNSPDNFRSKINLSEICKDIKDDQVKMSLTKKKLGAEKNVKFSLFRQNVEKEMNKNSTKSEENIEERIIQIFLYNY